MNQIVAIVGPTGTGKTKRAIKLSLLQSSILVSADSRQVFRGMDIVTGKDHPKNVSIYGIDIVSPDEPCSVSVWFDAVMPHIRKAWAEGKLPIVVGGTGLYVKAITEGIETMGVPINDKLREILSVLSISELQTKIMESDLAKYESMNESDRQNPRRLIRAIEISQSNKNLSKFFKVSSKIIGLNPPDQETYRKIIKQRVIERLEQGAISETKSLLTKYDKNLQSMSAIGYKSIINFLEGKITRDEMIEDWVDNEIKYAKRQLTWFRKQPVIWYDIDNTNAPTSPQPSVGGWYDVGNMEG